MPSPRTPASALSLASVPESFESGRVSVALGNCIVMSLEVPELPAGGAVKLAAIVLVVQVPVFCSARFSGMSESASWQASSVITLALSPVMAARVVGTGGDRESLAKVATAVPAAGWLRLRVMGEASGGELVITPAVPPAGWLRLQVVGEGGGRELVAASTVPVAGWLRLRVVGKGGCGEGKEGPQKRQEYLFFFQCG